MSDTKQMDLDCLDELIGKCEDSMVAPFRKKKAKPEAKPEVEAKDESDDKKKPDLSEMEMDELLEMYRDMKKE